MSLADEMEVTRQAISRWEAGVATPSTENLRKLAELYGVSVDSLLNESVDIMAMQKDCQTTEEMPQQQEKSSVRTTSKSVIYVVFSAILALLIFLAGYMTGRADTEQTQDNQIPLSELETMDLDFSDAVKSTFGWPDFGEGGE